jgi:hypothetical protein
MLNKGKVHLPVKFLPGLFRHHHLMYLNGEEALDDLSHVLLKIT